MRVMDGPEVGDLDPYAAELLALTDLTAPAEPPHAVRLVLLRVRDLLREHFGCAVEVHSGERVLTRTEHYGPLLLSPEFIDADAAQTVRLDETWMLRGGTSVNVPRLLGELPHDGGIHLVCVAGPVYRRDRIDPLHVGVPHQLDVWPVRTSGRPLGERDLTDLLEAIISGLLPDSEWWTQRHPKGAIPYNRASRELHCRSAAGVDVEVLECGLATPSLLASCGLPRDSSGLGLGMGLDRMAMLIKGIDDIRLLRAEDPRVREQMYDLSPYEPVDLPGRVVALELHRRRPVDEREIGDDVRRTLGPDQSVVQSICVLSVERLQSAGGRPPGDPDSVVARIAIELRDVNGPLDERQAELIVHRLRQSLDSPLH